MRKFLVIAAAALLVAGTAHAAFLSVGTSEVAVSGLLDFDTAGGTLLDMSLFYGYFVMDYLEVGAKAAFRNDDDITQYSIGPKVDYNFDIGSEFVPYVGGFLLYSQVDSDFANDNQSAVSVGGEVGGKLFLTEYMAISAALVAEVATDEVYPSEDGLDSYDARIELGMRTFF